MQVSPFFLKIQNLLLDGALMRVLVLGIKILVLESVCLKCTMML